MKQNYFVPIKGALFCGLLWLMSVVAFAQKSVSGKVSDAKGDGVPGASITVKGTTTGTISDATGNFKINVPNSGGTLVFSSIGYKTQEVKLTGQASVNVTLEDDAAALDEVVVTGYSIDKRRESTGAISTVKSKDLTAVPSGNVEQQLQGRVSGLTVVTNGQPGTASQIRVRGFGAFGGNEPLYVVDGMPVSSTDFLSPDDIESTTVLKDASTASIYGARAANGVIVYTTKKGTKGAKKLNVTYDGNFGITDPGKGQAMMNPTDFATWTWNAKRNSGEAFGHPQFGSGATPVIPDYLSVGGTPGVIGSVDLAAQKLKYNVDPAAGAIYQVIKANKAGTDWYGAITRQAPLQRHSLGFSGGGENSRFYVGFSLQDQKGILISNGMKRYAFRINSEFNVLKNLRIGENIQMTYLQILGQTGAAGGNGIAADENDILQAFRMPSIIPIYDEFGGYAGTAAKGFNNPRNPVANQNGIKRNRNFNGLANGNVYVEYDPIPGLTLRSSIAGNYRNNYGWGYTRWQYENSENNSAFGYNEFSGYSFGWTFTNTASYKKAFGKHNIEVLAGQEALNTGAGRNMNANGLNPFSQDGDYVTLTTLANRNPPASNLFKGVNFYSLFGRAIYTLNDKYIVTGVIRRDGSSRFGVNSRYGIFPAVSAAWRVSSESFMKNLPWVQDLKVRGGYGTMGNSNNVDPNNQYSLYAANVGNSGYDINGSNSSIVDGYYRTRIGNPDARWETSVTKNIGIDGSFLKGKLDVIFDLWQKDTKDLLYQLPITATAGFQAAAPSVNVGQMVNKGIDIQIINRGKITSDLGYDINVTGSFLKNEITKIADGQTYLTNVNPGFRGLTPIRNQLGYGLSSFYGFQVLGLFQSKAEVDAAPAQDGKGVGRFRYADINNDGKIDANDRTYLGSPIPKFTGGVNFTLTYKGFDLSAYLYTSIGNKIFNASKWFTDFYPSFSGAAISERVKESWTPQNTGAKIPIFETASNFSTNTQANSFYVENGSYLRLQNVAIGYNFSKALLDKLKLSRVRVFAATNNLFTITKYEGLDPQVGGNADTNFGIDVGNYPMTRSFTAGINLGF
ncbi:TonB-dependent receptor [Emticicia oligotrophica DSM 17448]|uniref:TonB-dependent receptor n=1 Tax=Emticicia oligotrophica (strain DSM 17448 / CIP 109782 / MTCC 6937 / GPTSA100-15) TaxID=929562 RepID=A0ABM5MZ10_EMTOG|nr:TonB-dependent receptor [Emticicia oligotrophica]AFK02371.1 TonB-dependent receptor [Emticicia oligotrophica DSM 17448]